MIDAKFMDEYNALLIRVTKAEILSLTDPKKFENYLDAFNALINDISKMIIDYEYSTGKEMSGAVVLGGFAPGKNYPELKELQEKANKLYKQVFKEFLK